jgi:hypothetical protein
MIRKTLFSLILIMISSWHLYSQEEPDYREIFLEAESYFLFEEYNEALPLYLRLSNKFPENDNINYKIGVCYLNDVYEKEKAISYLERAVTDINPDYKENNFKEKSAPLESLFFLGNAYRINNQLDKAIETYQQFKNQSDPEIYDHKLVEEQIAACNNALDLKTRPVDFDIINLGDRINTRFSDIDPVVSGDETKMVYIQKQQFYDAVFFSEKVDGVWSYPRNIIPELGVDEDAYPTALSYDGSILLIYRSNNFIGDLYSSSFSDGSWSALTKLNDNINTKYWESHACLTKSSDTLYFTSNRKGGYGGLDIYFSVKDASDQWGTPVNLGSVINSIYNEETPFITSDGKTLYFSSYGHYNMGGYDVFYSTRLDENTWSVPINAGYPINTTEDDIFFLPVQNGNFAYFPRFLDGGLGLTDIYKLEVYSSTHPRKFRIKGLVSLPSDAIMTKPITIKVIDGLSRDTVVLTNANLETGEFTFDVPAGQYDLLIEGEEIQTTTSSVYVPKDYVEKEMLLKSAILLALGESLKVIPSPKIVDKIELTDSLIYVSSDEVVNIDLALEKNSDLYVSIYHESEYLATDSFSIDRKRFTYSYKPVPGKNILKLKLVDEDGNLSYKDVVIVYTPEKQTSKVVKEQSVTPAPVIIPVVPIPADVERFHQELYGNADGELKIFLGQIDLEGEKISSEDALIEYLKKNADKQDYTTQDVYDLILIQMQNQYIQSYIDQLIELSEDEDLKNTLLQLDPAKENINNLQELYDYLMSHATADGYETRDVNYIFSVLSQRAELLNLLEELTEISTGGLHQALIDLDPDKEELKNPLDLMNYLLKNTTKYGYTEEDALKLLFDYLETEDLNEIMKILIGTASGPLQDLLTRLNLEDAGIKNIADLYNYLLAQAKYNNYSDSDVINLFLNLLNVMDKKELVKKVEPPMVTPVTEEKKSSLLYYIIGAGLLIILFIFILLRRKDKKKKQE